MTSADRLRVLPARRGALVGAGRGGVRAVVRLSGDRPPLPGPRSAPERVVGVSGSVAASGAFRKLVLLG